MEYKHSQPLHIVGTADELLKTVQFINASGHRLLNGHETLKRTFVGDSIFHESEDLISLLSYCIHAYNKKTYTAHTLHT